MHSAILALLLIRQDRETTQCALYRNIERPEAGTKEMAECRSWLRWECWDIRYVINTMTKF